MKDFEKIKSYQERLRKQKVHLDKEKGREEALSDQLKSKYRCKSIAEAKDLLSEKKQKEKSLAKKIEAALEKFEKKYEDLLEED